MRLYNTLSMGKEEFCPIEEGKVRMYACGPTVYDYIHIGNARPMIMFDVLRRYLEYQGYEVNFVQNFTDIDDKIIKRAAQEGVNTTELTEKYIREYFIDAEKLGVKPATLHPRATENIDAIIEIIKTLIEKGFAYQSGGDVYFRTEKFDHYGALAHQPLEDLKAGARITVSEIKESPVDFVLWKSAKEGEPFWQSPWGDGRPGWHIECSAMAGKYLGKTIDIHCGGQDLTFPHHENEVAQSEAANGCKFVNYWIHNGFISIDNKKMSKSLGNYFTVKDAAESYGYDAIRMFMLMSHYRSPLNYSGDILIQAKNGLERLYTAVDNLKFLAENASAQELSAQETQFITDLDKFKLRFTQAMDDDLNTADAVSVIFEMIREINSLVIPDNNPSKPFAKACLGAIYELDEVLGILYLKKDKSDDTLTAQVEALIEKRQQARKNKDFATADSIRDQLKEMGIILEDTPQGIKWRSIQL